MSSGAFDTVEWDSWTDNFPGSTHEIGQDFHNLRLFTTSPEQLPTPLPDPDPRLIRAQLSPIYSSTYKAPPSPTHALFDFHGRPLQADNQSNRYYEPASSTQSYTILNAASSYKGHTPDVNDPFPALDTLYYSQDDSTYAQSYYSDSRAFVDQTQAYHSPMGVPYQQIQSFPASVVKGHTPSHVNDPIPAHDTLYYSQDDSTCAQSYYNDSQAFVDQTQAYHSAMDVPYQQIQSFPTSVVQRPSTVHPYFPLQPMVCRSPLTRVIPADQNPHGNHSATNPPYHPVRTSSLPVHSALPQEVVMGTCKWMKDDGTVCGAQIASATVPEHLATHGIKKMTGNFRLQCRWLECRLRGDRKDMNRESIVRHVREKHLGRKRTL